MNESNCKMKTPGTRKNMEKKKLTLNIFRKCFCCWLLNFGGFKVYNSVASCFMLFLLLLLWWFIHFLVYLTKTEIKTKKKKNLHSDLFSFVYFFFFFSFTSAEKMFWFLRIKSLRKQKKEQEGEKRERNPLLFLLFVFEYSRVLSRFHCHHCNIAQQMLV